MIVDYKILANLQKICANRKQSAKNLFLSTLLRCHYSRSKVSSTTSLQVKFISQLQECSLFHAKGLLIPSKTLLALSLSQHLLNVHRL